MPERAPGHAACFPGRALRRPIRTFRRDCLVDAPLLHVQSPTPSESGVETQPVVLGRLVRGVRSVGVSLSSPSSACLGPLSSAAHNVSGDQSVEWIEVFVARPSGPRSLSLLVVLGLHWLSLHGVKSDR